MQHIRCATAMALALSLASASWGQVVIGDFEGSDDGWAGTDGAVIAADNFYATDGDPATNVASTGDYALNVFTAPPGAFRWAIQLDNNDIPNLGALLRDNPIITADVAWVTSEWSADTDGNWARWNDVSVNSDGGWQQTNNATMTDAANPDFPGSWDQVNWGANHQRTISWDLTKIANLPADYLSNLGTSSFVQLNISTNFDALFNTSGGSFWIDNIRLGGGVVPEPSALALLGLGLMTAGAKRRRT